MAKMSRDQSSRLRLPEIQAMEYAGSIVTLRRYLHSFKRSANALLAPE
jgi:hypothetical protein